MKFNNKNICSNILLTEMLWYKTELVILQNMFLNLKLKYIIGGVKAQIEKKQGKLIYESTPSEDHNIKKN